MTSERVVSYLPRAIISIVYSGVICNLVMIICLSKEVIFAGYKPRIRVIFLAGNVANCIQ